MIFSHKHPTKILEIYVNAVGITPVDNFTHYLLNVRASRTFCSQALQCANDWAKYTEENVRVSYRYRIGDGYRWRLTAFDETEDNPFRDKWKIIAP